MESFDVIIVGAGPAGLKCAEVLGSSSLRVLLLEKNADIGPKVCAGGLTGKDIRYLALPESLIEFRYNRVNLHVNRLKTTVRIQEDFAFTIDRRELGQWQWGKLSAYHNVEVRTSARVSAITADTVTVNGERIGYRYLVGADGSASAVKRFVGLTTENPGVGIQYIVRTDAYRDFELFFRPKYFSAWYAWIFPHRGYVSIGCGATTRHLPAHELKANFHRWLREKDINITDATYEAFPMNYTYRGHRFGNVFLAGDAAGFLSSFTGEGIYQALVSGEETAKMILDPNFRCIKIPEILRTKERHDLLIRRMIEAGTARSLLFSAGALLFRIPRFARKAIEVFG